MKMTLKNQKRVIRKFVCELLGNMSFIERIKFVFSGEYIQALDRTSKRLRMEGIDIVRGAIKETGANPGEKKR